MRARLFLTLVFLLICSGAALAQTPDELPPALETVCDAETGAAYGLCNAYCEAMDCESDAPSASATACSKVRDKFQNVTGRDLPCNLSCPCMSLPQFANTLPTLSFCTSFRVNIAASPTSTFDFQAVVTNPGIPNPRCGYFNRPTSEFVILPITEEERAVCFDLVIEALAANGASCS
ncbi:MAG TPA: hypothetical protein VFR31_19405 [Thermoanaerobaculia bacterium]|nr:hypothetical protein [Thermoanaerobaculia bacterium]